MQSTGSTPTRNLLLCFLLEEGAGSLARRPLCRRCLHTFRSNAGVLQRISSFSVARARRNAILSCSFWHEETRRRCLGVLATRSLATREGKLSRLPELGRINRPGWTLNVQMMTEVLSRGVVPKSLGPLEEYDERVRSGRLRDDEHQRCT